MKFAHFPYLFCYTYLWLSSLSELQKRLTKIPPSNSQKTCTDSKSHSVFVSFSLATRSWSSRRSQMPMLLLSFPVAWQLNRCLLGSRTCATHSPESSLKLHVDRLNILIWRMHTHREHMDVTDHLGFFGKIIIQSLVYLHLINTLTHVYGLASTLGRIFELLSSAVSGWTTGCPPTSF